MSFSKTSFLCHSANGNVLSLSADLYFLTISFVSLISLPYNPAISYNVSGIKEVAEGNFKKSLISLLPAVRRSRFI